MGRVQGKVAIVTGGASGVGREDCLLLAREGARVIITDVDQDGGRALAKEIGEPSMFLRHDISSEDDWKTVMAAIQDRFGHVDAVVNNAGILLLASIEETTLEQWRKIQRVNADGYFLGCKYAVAALKKTGQRLDSQHVIGGGDRRDADVPGLQRVQGRRSRAHPQRRRMEQDPGLSDSMQLHPSRRYPDADDAATDGQSGPQVARHR